MSLNQFLRESGRLYVQALQATTISANHLKCYGGQFALAGNDAEWIRVEENGGLLYIDRQRDFFEIHTLGSNKWREYSRTIRELVRTAGSIEESNRRILNFFIQRTRKLPVTGPNLSFLTQEVMDANGNQYPQWKSDIYDERRRTQQVLDTLTSDTLLSIATTAYVFVTVDDISQATRENWEEAESSVRTNLSGFTGLAKGLARSRRDQLQNANRSRAAARYNQSNFTQSSN